MGRIKNIIVLTRCCLLCLSTFLVVSSCCSLSKCEIVDFKISAYYDNEKLENNIEVRKGSVSIILDISTECGNSGGCKPGYGGTADTITAIKIYQKSILGSAGDIENINNKLRQSSNLPDQVIRVGEIDSFLIIANDILLTRGYDIYDTGFDFNSVSFLITNETDIDDSSLIEVALKFSSGRIITHNIRLEEFPK